MEILEGELLRQWEELHLKLWNDPAGTRQLAGLFKEHVPDGYADRGKRICTLVRQQRDRLKTRRQAGNIATAQPPVSGHLLVSSAYVLTINAKI